MTFKAHCGARRALAGALLGAALLLSPHATALGADPGVLAHIEALQSIAAANGNNRAAGTAGYDRSADYVAERLRGAGYEVRFEEFTFPFFEERKAPVLLTLAPDDEQTPTAPEAIRTLANSGAADVTAGLRAVDLGLVEGAPAAVSTSGCEAQDFQGFERGALALVRRGTCPFQVKVENAAAAGAAGVIVMNEGGERRTGVFPGRLGQPAPIPVVGVSFDTGLALEKAARAEGAWARLAVDVETGTRRTRNVLAESPHGDPARTVVIGAHLDSVAEGPGINDNASGSAAVLEAAIRLAARLHTPATRLRFAFWGAEELGLLGSRHHVDALSDEERGRIALYINLDMVGSRNFGRFVQGAGEGAAGVAQRSLLAYFREQGLPVEERDGGGRPRGFGSDDASFAAKNIPTVGLYTGAGERKDGAKAAFFGGAADQPYDACYHQACDTSANIDGPVLGQVTDALTRTLETLELGATPAPAPRS